MNDGLAFSPGPKDGRHCAIAVAALMFVGRSGYAIVTRPGAPEDGDTRAV